MMSLQYDNIDYIRISLCYTSIIIHCVMMSLHYANIIIINNYFLKHSIYGRKGNLPPVGVKPDASHNYDR